MKNITKILLSSLLVINVYSQVNQQWVVRYNGSANSFDIANSLEIDASSNVYVYGTSSGTGSSTDIVINKYNSSGTVIWSRFYNGQAGSLDQTKSAFLDASGNSLITGFSTDSAQTPNVITLKYNSNGDFLWGSSFLPPGYNQGFGEVVLSDNNSNIYNCSYLRRPNGSYDISLLKYSPAGQLLDTAYYTISSSSSEVPSSMCLDNSGNLYILAVTNAVSGFDDILILKYNSSLNLIWDITFSGPVVGHDKAIQILCDNDNRIVLCAAINNSGSALDYALYRYDTSSALIMQHFYNGTGNSQDIPYAMTVDTANNIYVTGSSRSGQNIGTEDIVTQKVSPTAFTIWTKRYNGTGSGSDLGMSIGTDKLGNCYVGGSTDRGNIQTTYAILKYNPAGTQIWFQDYSISNNPEDFVYDIAIDNGYNVFVTGISFDSLSDYDIATIKYSQPIGITQISSEVPDGFSLSQNYPNPFNPVTQIRFEIPEISLVSLKVYDILGREIKTLVKEQISPGVYKVDFNGSDYPSGVYFYSLITEKYKLTKKLIILK